MPDTALLTHANNRVEATKTRCDQARSAVASADEGLREARLDLEGVKQPGEPKGARRIHAEALEALEAIRKQLASVETPADGEASSQGLEDALVACRERARDLQAAALAVAEKQSELAAQQAALQRAEADFRDAKAALATATEDQKERDGWTAAIDAEPLSTVKQRATDAQTSAELRAAQKRIEAALPEALRLARAARARLRRKREEVFGKEVQLAEDRADCAASAAGDASAGGRRTRRAFQARRRELGLHVSNADARLAAATAVLKRIGSDAAPALLTPAQSTALHGQSDAQHDATGLAQARDEAEEKELSARLDVKRMELEVVVDGGNPDDDGDVKAARTALETATTKRKGAEDDFTAAAREALWRWEAAAPPEAWSELDAYEGARLVLDQLAGLDPHTLVNALGAVESEYIAALDAERAAAASQQHFANELESARRALERLALQREA